MLQLVCGDLVRLSSATIAMIVKVVSGPDMEILDIVTRWPGSTHDARIFSNSRMKTRLETRQVRCNLFRDSGYPQLYYLYTPVPDPQNTEERQYNTAQKQTRKVVECLFGPRTKLLTSTKVIIACAVLHNIAIRRRELPSEDPERPMEQVDVRNVRPNERERAIRAAFILCPSSNEH
uniref:DDE Tnp4 domain-containing protein n=1 Tax=Timema tahoe TaxID=61484 RepID=A0A7R9ITS8_9NEOP|nr:unnamed protein product [Timema tahoe]